MDTTKLDITEQVDGATIQHGQFSDRIYLMKIGNADVEKLAPKLIELAKQKNYSKIFAKVPASKLNAFTDKGFNVEATVPLMYSGTEDAKMLGYYLNKERQIESEPEKLDKNIKIAIKKHGDGLKCEQLPEGMKLRKCNEQDVEQMAVIYGKVFPTYPFAIDNPEYLLETMRSHVAYFGVEFEGKLVSLASAEMDIENNNSEMTDFATLHKFRGKGLAQYLLAEMEEYILDLSIITAYTIARSVSPGMNITFAKLGYNYGGRLINNTNISGQIESMNIWYKNLSS